jgi:hypothetical protein
MQPTSFAEKGERKNDTFYRFRLLYFSLVFHVLGNSYNIRGFFAVRCIVQLANAAIKPFLACNSILVAKS